MGQPFLLKDGSDGGSEVILCDADIVILDQAEVCTFFLNSFFANVATEKGKDCHINNLEEQPSFPKIMQNLPTNTPKFTFKPVSGSEINKIVSSIDWRNAQG